MSKTPEQNDPTKLKWITPEQKKELCGIFKHEDEIWPDSFVQLWIPNDFNLHATVLGFKALTQDGKKILVAGLKNPFGEDSDPLYLPADEYKYWCDLPVLTKEMQAKQEEIWAKRDKTRMYPYPGNTKKLDSGLRKLT
jgi:hypothetical protein